MYNWTTGLNPEQSEAVLHVSGPLLILAGAGSGKTTVLVSRTGHILQSQDVRPSEICVLTFTNRAARSMLTGVGQLCGPYAHDVVGGTFHRVALKDLQRFAKRLGYSQSFTVIQRDDAKELMSLLRAEEPAAKDSDSFPSTERILDMISLALNTQTSINQVIWDKYRRYHSMSGEIEVLARKYFERKLAMNVMDFDDLLANWYALLNEHEDVALKIQSEVKAVLVDEYQDTNMLQSRIVGLLVQPTQNITVVGDDAQSIYGFRGADVSNILEFEKIYHNAQVHTLFTNYRSTPQILSLANESRRFAKEGFRKDLQSARLKGDAPVVVSCRDVNMQASFVAQRVLELINGGVLIDDIAVLYRAHHHAMELQLELTRRRIPFVVRLPFSEFGVEEANSDVEDDRVGKLTLSSVHQAKGLEWSHVFVIWMVEGKFPSELALREQHGLEEERRLFYVASTRAKDALYLVHPTAFLRSRFIEEITSIKKCQEMLTDHWVVEEEIKSEQRLSV